MNTRDQTDDAREHPLGWPANWPPERPAPVEALFDRLNTVIVCIGNFHQHWQRLEKRHASAGNRWPKGLIDDWPGLPEQIGGYADLERYKQERRKTWEVGHRLYSLGWLEGLDNVALRVRMLRAAIDTAVQAVDAVAPYMDPPSPAPMPTRWTYKLRRSLLALGGIIHRNQGNDLPVGVGEGVSPKLTETFKTIVDSFNDLRAVTYEVPELPDDASTARASGQEAPHVAQAGWRKLGRVHARTQEFLSGGEIDASNDQLKGRRVSMRGRVSQLAVPHDLVRCVVFTATDFIKHARLVCQVGADGDLVSSDHRPGVEAKWDAVCVAINDATRQLILDETAANPAAMTGAFVNIDGFSTEAKAMLDLLRSLIWPSARESRRMLNRLSDRPIKRELLQSIFPQLHKPANSGKALVVKSEALNRIERIAAELASLVGTSDVSDPVGAAADVRRVARAIRMIPSLGPTLADAGAQAGEQLVTAMLNGAFENGSRVAWRGFLIQRYKDQNNLSAFAEAVEWAGREIGSKLSIQDPADPSGQIPPECFAAVANILDNEAARIDSQRGDRSDDGDSQTVHAEDFTWVIWYGQRYTFTKGNQAESVKALWESWERSGRRDGCGLSQATIKEKVESSDDEFRLAPVFRGHPAWKTMIRPSGKGAFALYSPESGDNSAF